jgi:hypothetical protein
MDTRDRRLGMDRAISRRDLTWATTLAPTAFSCPAGTGIVTFPESLPGGSCVESDLWRSPKY